METIFLISITIFAGVYLYYKLNKKIKRKKKYLIYNNDEKFKQHSKPSTSRSRSNENFDWLGYVVN